MDALRGTIDHALLSATGLLSHAVGVWLPGFWHAGAHAWLLSLLLAALLALAVLGRTARAARRERGRLRAMAEGVARSDGDALVRLVFDALFRATGVPAACLYLATVPDRPLLLRAKEANPAAPRQPDWEPGLRLDGVRTESSVTRRGNLVVLSLPVAIARQPLAVVQLVATTGKAAARMQACAGSLRVLLAPVLAHLVALEKIQRLEDRAAEASVVSGSSQRLLNASVAPEELANLLLDLMLRSTGSDAGLILAGREAPRVLAAAGLAPAPVQAVVAAAPDRAAPLRREGFAAILDVPLGDASARLGTILLAKRAGAFQDNHARICRLNATRLALALENRAYHAAVFEQYKETLGTIVTTSESATPFSAGHSGRVARLAALLARRLGLPDADVAGIRLAGELHDLGMAGLGDDILLGTTRLTGAQYDLVKHHPVIGATLTAPIQLPIPIAPLILHHHERYDGLGYPAGLEGPDIPMGARILALAEVFDALVSARGYRAALDFAEAKRRLVGHAGSQLDPAVVEVFDEIVTAAQWQLIATSTGE